MLCGADRANTFVRPHSRHDELNGARIGGRLNDPVIELEHDADPP
jgi:hypothetical protein